VRSGSSIAPTAQAQIDGAAEREGIGELPRAPAAAMVGAQSSGAQVVVRDIRKVAHATNPSPDRWQARGTSPCRGNRAVMEEVRLAANVYHGFAPERTTGGHIDMCSL
jgi:hypothetical protein